MQRLSATGYCKRRKRSLRETHYAQAHGSERVITVAAKGAVQNTVLKTDEHVGGENHHDQSCTMISNGGQLQPRRPRYEPCAGTHQTHQHNREDADKHPRALKSIHRGFAASGGNRHCHVAGSYASKADVAKSKIARDRAQDEPLSVERCSPEVQKNGNTDDLNHNRNDRSQSTRPEATDEPAPDTGGHWRGRLVVRVSDRKSTRLNSSHVAI